MSDITEFLLARIAADEAVARAVPPLGHNFDMGGNRQDERFTFGRSLPSSADGMGNWSEHRSSPTTHAHFTRHDPARVLAECEAKRRIVELAGRGCGDDYERVQRALALPYADHADYDKSWRM